MILWGRRMWPVVRILFWSVMMLLVLGVNGNEYFMSFIVRLDRSEILF